MDTPSPLQTATVDPTDEQALLTAARNVCLRMVNQADDAAELTQDTLVKAVQKLDGFRGESRFGTWLTRVAMNGCLSHLRKRKLRRTASLDADLPGAAALRLADSLPQSREPDAHSRVEQEDGLRQLYEALAQLDEDHRAVIVPLRQSMNPAPAASKV